VLSHGLLSLAPSLRWIAILKGDYAIMKSTSGKTAELVPLESE
jgi:hypothetical protein